MTAHLKCFGLAACLTFVGCGVLPTEPSGALPILQIHKEGGSGVISKREEVISSQARWHAVWQEINSYRSPSLPEPVVDFASHVLIFVARGVTGDACRSIAVERVELRHGSFDVFVNDERAPLSCSCPPITVQPVDVVAVPRVAETATFQYTSITVGKECN
jgi:hypothetical protein